MEREIFITGLDEAEKMFGELARELDDAVADGLYEVGTRMKVRMQEELTTFGLAGSNLASTIEVVPIQNGVLINVGAEYAMYVEYGTGIVGSSSPHPDPEFDWIYDINNHGEKGWVYHDETGFHRTRGQKAHPFVYNTWLYGRRIVTRIVNKHINNILKKYGSDADLGVSLDS